MSGSLHGGNTRDVVLDELCKAMDSRGCLDVLRHGFKVSGKLIDAAYFKPAHPNNPVLSWCISNVVVQMDPAGNVKPNRERSGEKIDGVVAMAMAIGRIIARPPEPYIDIRVF